MHIPSLSRRHALLSISALGALALAGRSIAQQDFSQVEIKADKLSDTVYMLTGAGGNLGLSVGPDAVFLIDDQFAPLAPKIKAAIAKITPKPVSFLRVFVFSPTSTQDAGAGSTPARSSTAHPTIEEIQRLTHLASV